MLVGPSAPRLDSGHSPDFVEETLGPYFAALQRSPLLSARDELLLAREIDRLVIEHWRVLLSYDRALPSIVAALDESLPDCTHLLAAMSSARRNARARATRATGPRDNRRSLMQYARQLRRLDSSGVALRSARAAVEVAFADDSKAKSYLVRVAAAHAAERAVKDRFVRANLRLVISMARRHDRNLLSLPDLIQEGNFGLMRAVEGFDHRRGYRFSTYATWWIRQAIRRALADKGRLVRVPVHALDDISRIARARGSIVALTGAAPDVNELSIATGVPLNKLDVLSTPGLLKNPVSMDRSSDDESDRTLQETLPADNGRNADDVAELASWRRELERLFERLTPMEAATLRQRYGLDGQELTLREIGEKYGLSRERIRQIQAEALAKLRKAIAVGPSNDDGENGLAA